MNTFRKWAIDIGHNCPPDTGTLGLDKSEDQLVTEVGHLLIKKLAEKGIQITKCQPKKVSTVKESLQCRCDAANNADAELYISIHFNAYNSKANGVEVFAVSPHGQEIAQKVVSAIASLGYFSRGVKDGSHLYVIRNTSMPAILIECCFCDSEKDMGIYNAEKMADAIVSGLLS